jgi:menaquinone-dependent protoporphyrinogen oxidase
MLFIRFNSWIFQRKEQRMSSKFLVGYATRYGSTREAAEVIAATLQEGGFEVDLLPVRDVRTLENYTVVVLGAPLFMFRWHKDALRFLSRFRKVLSDLPVAVFALGPVTDPYKEEEWQGARAQLEKELAKVPWFKPAALEIFGGRLDPQKLGFPMKLFAGQMPASDIVDPAAVRTWAEELPGILG